MQAATRGAILWVGVGSAILGNRLSQSLQEIPVASVCDVCGKGPGFGHNVPWSKKKTNRRWDPNIQTVRVDAGGGNTRRLQVCTSCIKAGKVMRASRA